MGSPKAQLGTVNIVEKAMIEATAQHLVRSALNMTERTISKLSVKVMVLMINKTKAGLGLRKARSVKSSIS